MKHHEKNNQKIKLDSPNPLSANTENKSERMDWI